MPPALAVAGGAVVGGLIASRGARKQAGALSDAASRAEALANQPRRTQYGSFVDPTGSLLRDIDPVTGQLRGSVPGVGSAFFDPSIRALREQSLANIPSYQSILRPQLTSTIGGLGQTRGRLEDLYGQTNDNAFMDPLLQRLALARGELTRGLTNRGLGGSSFYSQALGNFESAAAPGIAQARQQGISARQNILEQLADTDVAGLKVAGAGTADLQNLDSLYADIAGQNLKQELAALGLSEADVGAILEAGQLRSNAAGLQNDALGRILSSLGGLIPSGGGGGGGTPFNPAAGQYGGII